LGSNGYTGAFLIALERFGSECEAERSQVDTSESECCIFLGILATS
jgi:hypothetical protein